MKERTPINGISTPADFAEHIRRVEQYLAGDDPVTKLMTRLTHQVESEGPASLTESERHYYAVNRFLGAIMNGCVADFLVHEGLSQAVCEALALIGEGDKIVDFQELVSATQTGCLDGLPREDDMVGSFVTDLSAIESKMDDYVQKCGLL